MKHIIVFSVLALLFVACSSPTQGPTTWIDRPLDGDQVALELVTIQAHASDANGIGKFEFFINNSLLSTPAGSGTRFSQAIVEWIPPAPGTYVVRARSVNGSGAVGPEAKSVIVVGNMTPTPAAVETPAPPQADVTVTPPAKPVCPSVPIISTFTANPSTITAGGTSTLTWDPITNADSAVINQGIGGADLSGGSLPVQPVTTTTYVLSATGCGGTVVQSVTVTVLPSAPVCPGPPVIASFNANPGSITVGQSSTLSWGAVTNATSAVIDPGIGGVGTPGSTVVSPAGTTTYSLTATGCGGSVRRQVTIVVNAAAPPPPGVTFIPILTPMIFVPPPDTTPPSISNVSANPTSISQSGCGQTTRTTVSATATDASGIDHVIARLGGVGSGEVPMGAVGGNVYRAAIGPFNSVGQLTIRVAAWDKAGNLAQSGSINVGVVCIK